MKITHHDWGILLTLPSGESIEIHSNLENNLSSITLNGIPQPSGDYSSCDLSFHLDGSIYSDGHQIAPPPTTI